MTPLQSRGRGVPLFTIARGHVRVSLFIRAPSRRDGASEAGRSRLEQFRPDNSELFKSNANRRSRGWKKKCASRRSLFHYRVEPFAASVLNHSKSDSTFRQFAWRNDDNDESVWSFWKQFNASFFVLSHNRRYLLSSFKPRKYILSQKMKTSDEKKCQIKVTKPLRLLNMCLTKRRMDSLRATAKV